jgi:hypothetical protein
MQGHGGFQWPESGRVECSDWDPEPRCGGGLHGLLWGEGNGELLSKDTSARWLVVRALAADVVKIDAQKAKFPRGVVVFCGAREDAVLYLLANGARGHAVAYARVDDAGTATAGTRGTATAGDAGTATAGDAGTATAGTRGTATAGDAGTATAGYDGTATAGTHGTATAGDAGIIVLRWYDGKRYRLAVRYCGEDGVVAGVRYRCTERGEIVRADAELSEGT